LFTGRRQADLVGGPDGALGHRVEVADGVDLVVPQFDAQRPFGPRGKNVQDPAPVAETSRRLYDRLVVVAQVQPLAEYGFDPYPVALLPEAQRPRGRENSGHQLRWQCVEQCGTDRADHQRLYVGFRGAESPSPSQRRQGGQPLVAGVGVNCQPLVWEHFGFWQEVNGLIFAQIGQQLVVETPGVVGTGRDHQERPPLAAP